jgi:hypothetical protein
MGTKNRPQSGFLPIVKNGKKTTKSLGVRYSVFAETRLDRDRLENQILASVRSLRIADPTIPVVIFEYEDALDRIQTSLISLGAKIYHIPSYYSELADIAGPRISKILRHHPALHRWLNLSHPAIEEFSYLLQVDCDTLFFKSPRQLLAKYDQFDLSARCYSQNPVDQGEAAMIPLERLYRAMDSTLCKRLAPFNCGTILFSKKGRAELKDREQLLVSMLWRLLVWMKENPTDNRHFGESRMIRFFDVEKIEITAVDQRHMIEYPSPNRWLLDEVAMWLTCGAPKAISIGKLQEQDVGLGIEFLQESPLSTSRCVYHYYSSCEPLVAEWLTTPLQKEVQRPRKPSLRELQSFDDDGYIVAEGVQSLNLPINELIAEARSQYRFGSTQAVVETNSIDGRAGHPLRQFRSAGGGLVLGNLSKDSDFLSLLHKKTGVRLSPTGSNGTYSYYLNEGDFIDLHLDVVTCDVVLIVCLQDDTTKADAGGSLVLYPTRRNESISSIHASPNEGRKLVKLAPGDSIILCGGLVPHCIFPVASCQNRIVAVICFQPANEA